LCTRGRRVPSDNAFTGITVLTTTIPYESPLRWRRGLPSLHFFPYETYTPSLQHSRSINKPDAPTISFISKRTLTRQNILAQDNPRQNVTRHIICFNLSQRWIDTLKKGILKLLLISLALCFLWRFLRRVYRLVFICAADGRFYQKDSHPFGWFCSNSEPIFSSLFVDTKFFFVTVIQQRIIPPDPFYKITISSPSWITNDHMIKRNAFSTEPCQPNLYCHNQLYKNCYCVNGTLNVFILQGFFDGL